MNRGRTVWPQLGGFRSETVLKVPKNRISDNYKSELGTKLVKKGVYVHTRPYSRVHYGYRRIHIMLQREGYTINHKRVYRIYNEQLLQMRTKKPRRRVQEKPRKDRVIPLKKNDIWSMDFVSDALFTGERFVF